MGFHFFLSLHFCSFLCSLVWFVFHDSVIVLSFLTNNYIEWNIFRSFFSLISILLSFGSVCLVCAFYRANVKFQLAWICACGAYFNIRRKIFGIINRFCGLFFSLSLSQFHSADAFDWSVSSMNIRSTKYFHVKYEFDFITLPRN